MSKMARPWDVATVQRLLGRVAFGGLVLTLLLLVFVAKFEFLDSTTGLAQAEVARNIATGQGLTTSVLRPLTVALAGDRAHSAIMSAPLYSIILSAPMRVFGSTDKTVVLTSLIFTTLTLILTGLLCLRVFGERVALGAVAILALTVPFMEQAISGDELACLTLILTVLFGTLLLWRESSRQDSPWWTIAVTVIMALAWYVRFEMIVLLPVVLLYWALADGKRFWSRLAWTVGLFVVLTAPWIVRNSLLLDRPIVSAYSYSLLTDTSLYPKDAIMRAFADVPDHPWLVAAAHPGMICLKVINRLRDLYYLIPLAGNPFVTAFFLVGVVLSTARRRLSLLHWSVLLAVALTAFVVAMYANTAGLLICFVPVVTILAVYNLTEIVGEFDREDPSARQRHGSRLGGRLRLWAGLSRSQRGSGRVISFALVALTLVVSYPMLDYLFIRPPARVNPVVDATVLLGEKPYELIVSDIPFAVAWFAGKDAMLLPGDIRDLERLQEAGLEIDAIYMRPQRGMSKSMFPGFEWVEDRELPGVLWERASEEVDASPDE